MNAWTVLMDYAMQPDDTRCPYGLLLPVEYGHGAIVQRCDGKAKHKEPHHFETTYPTGDGYYTHVTVEWHTNQTMIEPDGEKT